jgi:hypothetical protein
MQGADAVAERAVGEAGRGGDEAAESSEDSDDARVTPAQGRSRLAVVIGRQDDLLDGPRGNGAVLGRALDGEQAVVDVAPDGAEVGEVADVPTRRRSRRCR